MFVGTAPYGDCRDYTAPQQWRNSCLHSRRPDVRNFLFRRSSICDGNSTPPTGPILITPRPYAISTSISRASLRSERRKEHTTGATMCLWGFSQRHGRKMR
ncbi:hypothetical protein L798_10541 [Zootermopsis nevadensis]|uniref:Uncharacterized protein n=1 Tax=Zootermopsis nevadensis TaxID=136037 RepID=A0A067QYN0_ZOONE|nr:hypothetical protein L798_10541 [Zootermopsis nevadensis]